MKRILIASLLMFSGVYYTNAQGGIFGDIKKAVNKNKSTKETPNTPKGLSKDIPNNGVSGPIHQKNMGKVVFAKTEAAIEFKQEIESEFITEATLGDPIYMRAYMDNSLVNYLKGKEFAADYGDFLIKFHLDGKELFKSGVDNFSSSQKTEFTTFRGALKGRDSYAATGEKAFKAFVREHEAQLTPGKHLLRVEFVPYYKNRTGGEVFEGDVVAYGEITLEVKGPIFDPNDPKVCMPTIKQTDKKLEAAIVKAYKEKGYKSEPLEIRITSPSWKIVRNEISGVPTQRTLNAVVAISKNGKCLYQDFTFAQDYDGSNYQDYLYLHSIGGDYDISCNCIKNK